MEFPSYLRVLRKWLWLVLLATAVSTIGGFVIASHLPKQYAATLTLLVNDSSKVLPGTQFFNDNAERIGETYAQLVKSRPVLTETIKRLNLPYTPDALGHLVTSRLITNTQLIEIQVKGTDPQQIASIANTIGEVFITQNAARGKGTTQSSSDYLQVQLKAVEQQISDSQRRLAQLQAQPSSPAQQADVAGEQAKMSNFQSTYATVAKDIQDIRIADAALTGTVDIVQPAAVPLYPSSPTVRLTVLISALLGLIVGAGLALALDTLDTRVNSPEIVREVAGYPSLGTLFAFKHKDLAQHSIEAEAYRMLRTNLMFTSLDRPWQTLLITSPVSGDGKSTVACNLAIVLAESGKRVILADLDLRRPAVHSRFDLPNVAGLTDLLMSGADDVENYLLPTPFENLHIVTAGTAAGSPAELIGSDRMANLLRRLGELADLVVLDTTPLLAVSDPAIVATRTDATLLIVDATRTRRHQLQSAKRTLETVGAHVIGVAINKAPRAAVDQYSSYYAYAPNGGRTKSKRMDRPRPPLAGAKQ